MPKKFTDFEIYVRVDLQPSWIFRERDVEERLKDEMHQCNEIVSSVTRHVDNVGRAYIRTDMEYTCSYCGEPWTEDDENFNGGCCDGDIENVPEPEEGI